MLDPHAAQTFLESLFGHELLTGHQIGISTFPPRQGRHAWHATPAEAAAWAMRHALDAGRLAWLAGRIPKKLYATASSPTDWGWLLILAWLCTVLSFNL